jgi:hypothetical protein
MSAMLITSHILLLPSWVNPFEWSTATYIIVIALLLIVHQQIPRGGSWYYRLGRETLLMLPAGFLYFTVRGIVDAREAVAYENAATIVQLQNRLGIFYEPTLQAWILSSDILVQLLNWIYIWGHWPVVITTLVWLVVRRPKTYSIYRNAFLISGVVGMLIFALYPVAPPRLMPDVDVVDTVTEQSRSYRVLQPPALTNPYAAMPSLHFGWNLLMGIALVHEARLRPIRLFGYVIPVMMFLGIVLTANHYVLDGVVGGLLVVGSLWISVVVLRFRGYDVWHAGNDEEKGGEGYAGPVAPVDHPLVNVPKPVTIAHRAGNDIPLARHAAALNVDIVEADVWLYEGRLEVRHSKTIGKLPLRWDRWWIKFWPPPPLLLDELLRTLDPSTTVMLDLKGRDPELPEKLLEVCRRERPGRQILACSQTWSFLEELRNEPDVAVIYSIGSSRQLRRAWLMLEREGYDAVSIHNELLTPESTRRLLDRVSAIITWPINDHTTLERVARLGVTGVISDSFDLLREIEKRKVAVVSKSEPARTT